MTKRDSMNKFCPTQTIDSDAKYSSAPMPCSISSSSSANATPANIQPLSHSPAVQSQSSSLVLKYIDPLISPDVKAELAKMSQEIADLKDEKKTAFKNLEVAASKWKALEEVTSDQDKKLFSKRLEAETLRKKIVDMSNVKNNLSVTTLVALADSLEANLSDSDIQISDFTRANAALIEENDELREAETALTLRVGDLEDVVIDSKLKISNLTGANEGLTTNNKALIKATEALDLAVKSQGMFIKELKDKIMAKSEDNNKLVHDKQALESMVKRMEKEIIELRAEVEASHCSEELTGLLEVSDDSPITKSNGEPTPATPIEREVQTIDKSKSMAYMACSLSDKLMGIGIAQDTIKTTEDDVPKLIAEKQLSNTTAENMIDLQLPADGSNNDSLESVIENVAKEELFDEVLNELVNDGVSAAHSQRSSSSSNSDWEKI